MINFKHVDFSYRKNVSLLTDLNLQIAPGHIHGLLGKNGEGKSTVLKLIAGLLFPQKGDIEVLGFNPGKRKPEMLREIYFIPEELPSFTLSIEQFAKVYAPFYPKFNTEQFSNYLNEFEIDSVIQRMDKLSYGQKKKVLIAFGLAANTKIILMDEPTNGLDIPSKGQFRRMAASAIDDERSMIISTHQVRDLDRLIDNIIIMSDHEIVFNESIENITDKLVFKVFNTDEKDASPIYSEETLRGFYQVRENLDGEDSKLDIELLFNAVLADTNRIKEIFTTKS